MNELESQFAMFKWRVNTITGKALIELDKLKIDIDKQFYDLLPKRVERRVSSQPDACFLNALLYVGGLHREETVNNP